MLLSPLVLNAIAEEQRELFSCRAELQSARREAARYKHYLAKGAYTVGSRIDFSLNGNSSFYTAEGWGFEEARGRWTEGRRATLHIRFAKPPKRPLRLNALLAPLLHETYPEQEVRVLVGGNEVARWNLKSPDATLACAEIPADKLHDRQCEIAFEMRHALRPADLGMGSDHRELGAWFRSLDLQWADTGAPLDAASETPSEAIEEDGNVS